MKKVIRFIIKLMWSNSPVEKYLPTAVGFFLTLDELTNVINQGVKAMKDGKLDKEERLILGSALELYRVALDDSLVAIIEHLQEENDA